jgi:subtilisin family serine protease
MHRRRLTASTSTAAFIVLSSLLAACKAPTVAPAQSVSSEGTTAQLGSCPPPAVAPAQADPLTSLTAKAQQQGAVRVIVRLAAAPDRLATAQSAAVQTFSTGGAEEVTLLSARLPYVVAEVSADELTRMYSDPQFAEWSEDRLAYPSLSRSGPQVEAPQLWAIGGRGKGQAVAILDTGVDRAHPFLSGRIVAEACFSTTSAANRSASVCPNGQSTQTGEGAAAPCRASGCDHGAHVAGIAAGRGADFSGIAPDADIIAVQVFSQFSGAAVCGGQSPCVASFTSDQIRALDFVLQQSAQRPVAAANMSLGGGRAFAACDADATKPVIDQLRAAGVATAIASGNEGFRDSVSFPGCISTAVTVGAVTAQDRLASFSNCGPQVDLHAPGVDINSSVPGGRFASFSGTSMATPHVAGAFAALRSLHPNASVGDIEAALKSSGLDAGGRPRIRVAAASTALSPATGAVAVVGQPPAVVQPALQQTMTELAALPPDTPVRIVVGPAAANAQPQSVADAMSRVEAAARNYGATAVERIGAQPLLAIECTARQARDLAASGLVATMQLDRPAKTQ